jgi:hypothetical protein
MMTDNKDNAAGQAKARTVVKEGSQGMIMIVMQ